MAYIQYLNFDGEDLPLPISYDIGLSDVEALQGKQKPEQHKGTW